MMMIITRLAEIPEDTTISELALQDMANQMVPIISEELELDGVKLRVVKAWVEDGWVKAQVEIPDELRYLFGPPSGGYFSVREIHPPSRYL
jgi:hypothetical protein